VLTGTFTKVTHNKGLPPFLGIAKVSENLIRQNFELKFLNQFSTNVNNIPGKWSGKETFYKKSGKNIF